jgi:hypothetical protein
MTPSTFVPDPLFFADPDGICGLNMAKKAGFNLGDTATGLFLLLFPGAQRRPPRLSSSLVTMSPKLSRSTTVLPRCYIRSPQSILTSS